MTTRTVLALLTNTPAHPKILNPSFSIMNSTKKLLIGGTLIACLCVSVAISAAPSANGAGNSANSGASKAPNANSQTNNGQGNQKAATPGNNGLAKGHEKQLAELMQEFDAFFTAGESGDVSGYSNAARLLMAGDKDFTNLDSAMAILDKAIKLGSSEAKYLKGALLIGRETDITAGLNYLMEAAQANYPDAKLLLARLYKEGKHLPQDNQAAAEWAKFAADLGLPSANVDFARLTLKKTAETGEGDVAALKRLLVAANQNNPRAALQVSTIYLSNSQRTSDECVVARKFAQIAYDNGLSEGAFMMAVSYLPDDPDTALDWLEKGSSQDDWKCLYANRLITNEGASISKAVGMAAKASRKTAMNYAVSTRHADSQGSTPRTLLSYVMPKIPAALRGMDLQVEIKLKFTVNVEGIPTDIQVIEPSEYDALNTAATEAIAKWRYKPATKNGRPVPSQVILPVKFKPAR